MKKNLIIILTIISIIVVCYVVSVFLQVIKEIGRIGENLEPVKIEPIKVSDVVVFSPKANNEIRSPLKIEGKARGFWFFEASFPVKILDSTGKELGRGIMQAKSDWMTTDFVPFEGEIEFQPSTTNNGLLVLEKDNPSGLPENDKSIEIPIRFSQIETIKVKVYFNNNKLDPEFSCNKVFPVERIIPKTQAPAREALELLLEGPSSVDIDQGFFTNINPDVKIQSLTIENGVAKVDFDEQLEFQVGGSCRVAAIRAEITQTLKQFSTVKEVIISINGRTEDILQP